MNKTNFYIFFLSIFSVTSLLLGFYLNEDGSGNPLSGDFFDTWPYVLELTKNFFIDPSPWTLHFPLHYFLLSKLFLLLQDSFGVRLLFCIFSIITPYLFFICLKKYNKNANLLSIVLLSLTLLFTPSFRYSAIWANDQITFYIFVFIGTYFFIKTERTNKNSLYNTDVYLYLFFFALACYSRQFYAVLYALFILNIYQKYSFKNCIIFSIFSILLAIPGLLFLFKYQVLYEKLVFSGNIANTIFGNVSAILIYTFPLFFLNFKIIKEIGFKQLCINIIISLFVFLLIFIFSNTNSMGMNGGLIFFFSKKIFNNLIFFYISFILSVFILLNMFKLNDLFIILVIILMTSGIIVLPKYFEPLILVFFLLYSSSEYKNIFYNQLHSSFILYLYYIIYYIIAVSDIMYFI